MNDSAGASTDAVSEHQAQSRLVGLLRVALPGVEVVTEYRLGDSPQYMADIAIPHARLVIEIKRRRDAYVVRQADRQMARLNWSEWTGLLVFSDDPEAAARQIAQQVYLAWREQP